MGCPQPGFLASTTTTPMLVTNTVVLPPPPFSRKRLSLSFSTSLMRGAFCPAPPPRCPANTRDTRPTPNTTLRRAIRFIQPPQKFRISDYAGLTLRVRKFRFLTVILLALLPAAQAQTVTRRQPAPVMGVGGADWLTRSERIQEEEPDRMLSALDIQKGATVADIGAGVGHY